MRPSEGITVLTLAHDCHFDGLLRRSPYEVSAGQGPRGRDSRPERNSRRIETGGTFINGYAASDPRVPIGETPVSKGSSGTAPPI
jgi:hypothetical protein